MFCFHLLGDFTFPCLSFPPTLSHLSCKLFGAGTQEPKPHQLSIGVWLLNPFGKGLVGAAALGTATPEYLYKSGPLGAVGGRPCRAPFSVGAAGTIPCCEERMLHFSLTPESHEFS